MWAGTFALGKAIGLAYDRTATLAFTAAGNKFELAAVVATRLRRHLRPSPLRPRRPLIELPVLIGLVYVPRLSRRRLAHRWLVPSAHHRSHRGLRRGRRNRRFPRPRPLRRRLRHSPHTGMGTHFLRAAACFVTLTDVADRQLLACQGDRPQLPRLAESAEPPPTSAPGSSTDRARPRRVGLERTQRSRTLRASTDCTTPQTGILVRLEPAQRLVAVVSWRRTVSRWRSRRTRHP